MSTAGRRGAGGPRDHQAAAAPPLISAEQAAALLRKYQLLAVWRRSKDLGGEMPAPRGDDPGVPVAGDHADRAALRALSREFPGALRELDVLGLPEISRRIVRLTLLLGGTLQPPAEPPRFQPSTHGNHSSAGEGADNDLWMPLIAAYHGLMRVALTVKRESARTRAVSPAEIAKAQATVQASCGFSIDESFVQAAVRPPAGRLTVVVLTALAQRFRLPASDISRLLFPPRRII
ncbi:MAG: hypothetical protein ABJA82_06315 [Myxococcales bacterium]